jgi:protoporphyrinogen IX oxidase
MNSPVAWALVFHVVGFVFWMAGLLVATQIVSAHIEETSPTARQALARLESKLLRGVAHPGAVITVLAGITVLWMQPGYLQQHWLQAKLFLVAILIGLDLVLTWRINAFQAGRIELPHWESKAHHGAISLVFLVTVILVMIKPF